MKKKSTRLVPLNKKVEGYLSDSQTKMSFEVLTLFSTGESKLQRSKLTKVQKELFAAFCQEQHRLNQIAEVRYLKKYLSEQRTTANKNASYLRKRNAIEIKTYGKLPIMISVVSDKKCFSGAPVNKFRITNNINDLRSKVNVLDRLLRDIRDFIGKYEMEDWKREDRKNGGGFDARMSKMIRKKLRKVA